MRGVYEWCGQWKLYRRKTDTWGRRWSSQSCRKKATKLIYLNGHALWGRDAKWQRFCPAHARMHGERSGFYYLYDAHLMHYYMKRAVRAWKTIDAEDD